MKSGVFGAAGCLLLLATAARADGDYLSPTQDRVRVSLGLMQNNATTSFQLDASDGTPGTVIDGENTLGLERKQFDPKFAVEVRAGERSRLRIDYFSLDRNDTRTLTAAPISYGNVMLLTGDPVQTDLSIRAFGLSYGYSFVRNERFELAATLGISDVDVYSRLIVATPTSHINVNHSIAGPFPSPGLEVTWVISKRFYIDANAQYLKVAIHEDTGKLDRFEANALYRLRPNISFALGYTSVTSDLASRKSGNTGFADLSTHGPQLFIRVAF
jgi:hypothetical protein